MFLAQRLLLNWRKWICWWFHRELQQSKLAILLTPRQFNCFMHNHILGGGDCSGYKDQKCATGKYSLQVQLKGLLDMLVMSLHAKIHTANNVSILIQARHYAIMAEATVVQGDTSKKIVQ